MGVGRASEVLGRRVRAGQGRPLRRHDTMASLIRYGYWTKGQPGRRPGFRTGDRRARLTGPPNRGGLSLEWREDVRCTIRLSVGGADGQA
jgi:hypothetical protein